MTTNTTPNVVIALTAGYENCVSTAPKWPVCAIKVQRCDTSKHTQSYLLWPKSATLLCVLQIISDDVGLLEEQSHRVRQLCVPPHLGVLELRRRKQAGQADANEPCHIVTILKG